MKQITHSQQGPHAAFYSAPALTPKQQFWWGFLGGCLVLAFRVWTYANGLASNAPCPDLNFRTCLLGAVWIAFPFMSGLLSRVCEPHHPLIAVFEGVSAPALFSFIASDFPL